MIEGVLDALVARVREHAPTFAVRFRWDDRVGVCSTRGPCRQFAACEDTRPPTLYVAPRLARESRARVEGVLAHELGHALLFLAGRPDHTERAADDAAEAYLGVEIAYDQGDVQTTGPGARPRPARLG